MLPAQRNGAFWILSNEVEGMDGNSLNYNNLELTKENGKENIFHSRLLLYDFAVSHDGSLVCLIIASMDDGVEVQVLRKEKERWKICGQRRTSGQPVKQIDRAIFLDQASEQIAVTYSDAPWLEIWETAGELNKVAEVTLPQSVTCIAALDGSIGLGCQTGQLISYHLEKRM
jgi:hypothetical protein